MSTVTVSTTVDIDVDVDLSEIDTEDLSEELESRGINAFKSNEALEQIWLHYRGKDVPKCLSDFLWNTIGKAI